MQKMRALFVLIALVAMLVGLTSTVSAQSESCVTVNGNEVCGNAATIAAVLGALGDNPDQGGGEPAVPAPAEVQPGCFEVEGTLITEVPCEGQALADEIGQGGGMSLDFKPRNDAYAIGVEPVGQGWTRIREGVAPKEYFSWNFFTRVACDRPIRDGEVRWDRPIHLTIEPSVDANAREPITCLIEVKRDLDTSTNWQRDGHAADPYDSSLAGQGNLLGWFIGGYADVEMDNGQRLSLATEVCSDPNDCPVPTFTVNPPNGIIPTEQWSAAPGGEGEHHVAVIREFPRDFDGTLSWLVTVKPGDEYVQWQGVVIPQADAGGGSGACMLVANQVVNVRSQASSTASVVETLTSGQEAAVDFISADGWARLTGKADRWVSTKANVNLTGDCTGGAG